MDHAEVPGMNREQRLSRWIDLYSDAILKTCFLYLSDRQQAEDVLQDTWIKAWKHIEDVERKGITNEKAWLLRIAMNTCMDLPERYKQIVLLHYFQGLTLQETADVLGQSVSTAHRRLKKAEALLKDALEGGEAHE